MRCAPRRHALAQLDAQRVHAAARWRCVHRKRLAHRGSSARQTITSVRTPLRSACRCREPFAPMLAV